MKLQLKAYSTDEYKSMKDMYYWAQLVGKKKKSQGSGQNCPVYVLAVQRFTRC